jgi:hypothetical protein
MGGPGDAGPNGTFAGVPDGDQSLTENWFMGGDQVNTDPGAVNYPEYRGKAFLVIGPGRTVATVTWQYDYICFRAGAYHPVRAEALAAPTSLTALAVSANQSRLSWQDNANNEMGFQIERRTGISGSWAQITGVGANVTSATNGGLVPNTVYYYRVRAWNALGNSGWSNEAWAVTPIPPPAAPANLAATATSSTQIVLSWTDNSNNENGFRIERKTGAGGAWSQITTVTANVVNYSNGGLSPNTTYYYRVSAYNAGGSSAWSNEAWAVTPGPGPVAPTKLVATAASSTRTVLSWTDNSNNEDGFRIERKTGAGGSWSQIATVSANVVNYADSGLSPNTTYYYRVSAYNALGGSVWSNEAWPRSPSRVRIPWQLLK